jgi:hypothetical protein
MRRSVVVVAMLCACSFPMSYDEATEKYAKKLEPRITAMLAAAKVAETKRSDAQPTTRAPTGIDLSYEDEPAKPSGNAVLAQAEDLEALDRNGNPLGRFTELYFDHVRVAKALLGAPIDFKYSDWRARRSQVEHVLGAKYVFVVSVTRWREPTTNRHDGNYTPGSASARVSLVEIDSGTWHGNLDVEATNSIAPAERDRLLHIDTNADAWQARVLDNLRGELGRAIAGAIKKRWKAEVPYNWGYL